MRLQLARIPTSDRTHATTRRGVVDVMAIAEDRVIALYNDNREFGFYLVSLITKRLVANFEELERRVAATP